jgi:hypothetical protein
MSSEHDSCAGSLTYRVGLDPLEEAVISSHFMGELCRESRLRLYDDEEFSAKSLAISASVVSDRLLSTLRRASDLFAQERAVAAKRRAVENCARYGLNDASRLGPAEFITEVVFDRQFRRGPRETCSREAICGKVAQRIAKGAPIEMVIPALPFKLSCPLKTRGPRPDLAEVNFMLELYEIAAAVEVLYREAYPERLSPMARFTVVSDGQRFNRLVNESDAMVEAYRSDLIRWIARLQLTAYIEVIDYHALLRDRLPSAAREAKEAIRQRALQQYAETMWPVFDPCNMPASLAAARRIDPDPEEANREGRFVSLLKSLVYTVNYRSLDRFKALSAQRFRTLHQELTGHIFEPFIRTSPTESPSRETEAEDARGFPATLSAKEHLRQTMLREVWSATIGYVAEIKSDRELASEPISMCLPDHLRWTIHAKPGQLGLLTSAALGKPVLAWAGAAVFKRAKQNGIRLCTLPVLALEGAGAIPVRDNDGDDALGLVGQPLFYLYPDVVSSSLDEFLASLPSRLVRKRAS